MEFSMSAVLEQNQMATTNSQTPALDLRAHSAAVRVSFTWFGTRKSLTAEQRAEAAQPFDAEGGYLSAAKKILDNSHPSFKAVTAIKGKISQTWKGMSLPFPEPGIRLIGQVPHDPDRFCAT
jgi:hypothetical protein